MFLFFIKITEKHKRQYLTFDINCKCLTDNETLVAWNEHITAKKGRKSNGRKEKDASEGDEVSDGDFVMQKKKEKKSQVENERS